MSILGIVRRKDTPGTLPTADGEPTNLFVDANGRLHVIDVGGGGGGGGTEFAEDAAHSSGALGTLGLLVRKDTAVALAGTDGDYQPGIADASGRLWVAIGNTPVVTLSGTPNVAVTSHTTLNSTLLTSSARTADATVAFTNEYWKGVLLIYDVTAGSATPSVTPKIQIQDPVTSTWLDYWTAAAAVTATTATTLRYLIYPGANETEPTTITEAVNLPLPRSCRLFMDHGDADSQTYSVTAMYLI